MFCKSCGIPLPSNIAKCPKCSTDLQVRKDIKIFQPEPDKSPRRIKTLLLATGLIAAIGAVFFTYTAKFKPLVNQAALDKNSQAAPNTEDAAIDISKVVKEQPTPDVVTEPNDLLDSRISSLYKEGVDYFKKGNYQKAKENFEAALAEAPSHTAIKANLGVTLAKIAWVEMEKADYGEAIRLFYDALIHNPLLYNAQKGIGLAYIKLNEPQKAAPYIDAYIEKKSGDFYNRELLFSLAEAFLKKGSRETATLYLEKLINIDPYNNEARRRLALLKKENQTEEGFQKKEGSHFTVKFEGGENSDIGHMISIIMEEAYVKVGSDIGYYPEDRIEAVLYTQQQFADVTRAPGWAGALYDGRIKIPVGGTTNRTNLLEKVLFHEYAHALVHRLSYGKAPVWLNEGLAQHEEGAVNENINQVLAIVAKLEKAPPLRVFEGSFMGFNGTQVMIAYSVSLSATEYIINEFGMSAVKRILENVGAGKSMEEAISSSIYISYEDLQKNWFMALKKRYER
ncbi:MAG: tetratricopeptide repeat protein [Deltaproteobacteria bacterium]|nr:tetratricopeptide repeat protein [Deltaproteobacteria bacterium]